MRQHETEPQLLKDYHAVDELCKEPRKSMASVIVVQGDATDGCLERRRAHKPEESKPIADERSIDPFVESRGVGKIIKSWLVRRCLESLGDAAGQVWGWLCEELLSEGMANLLMLFLSPFLTPPVSWLVSWLVSRLVSWLVSWLMSRLLSAWRARGRR